MSIKKTGIEIVKIHQEYQEKINELENALLKLQDYGYTQQVIECQLKKLREELKALEETRFQALEPVVIATSLLGAKEYGY